MKRDVVALSKVSLKHRDTVNRQMWGRFPGTLADREGMQYLTGQFQRLGLSVRTVPYVLPQAWRPDSWHARHGAPGPEGTGRLGGHWRRS
jgi:hypothetical protein